MSRATVELRVAGQAYRVNTSAEETELRHLAEVVEVRLRAIAGPARSYPPQALLLTAIALAHDLERERERRLEAEQRSREALTALLRRIDDALELAESPEPPPAEPPATAPR